MLSGPELPNSIFHLSLQMSPAQLAKRAMGVLLLAFARAYRASEREREREREGESEREKERKRERERERERPDTPYTSSW